jgi:putative ABC transport system permease protein
MVIGPGEIHRATNWFNTFMNTFVLLTPGANLAQVERKMNLVYNADAKEAIKEVAQKYGMKDKKEYYLQPFTDMHLSAELPSDSGLAGHSNPQWSYILTGIALFILAIACINFVNLTVARSLRRAKEIGIRKVVGSGRMQLIFQFLANLFRFVWLHSFLPLCSFSWYCLRLITLPIKPLPFHTFLTST